MSLGRFLSRLNLACTCSTSCWSVLASTSMVSSRSSGTGCTLQSIELPRLCFEQPPSESAAVDMPRFPSNPLITRVPFSKDSALIRRPPNQKVKRVLLRNLDAVLNVIRLGVHRERFWNRSEGCIRLYPRILSSPEVTEIPGFRVYRGLTFRVLH